VSIRLTAPPPVRRWVSLGSARVVLGLVAMILAALLPAAPASAHATLLFTTPVVDGAVPDSPAVVQLVFDQAVTLPDDALSVSGTDGHEVKLGSIGIGEQPQVVEATVAQHLVPGEYVVKWQVVARDGDPMLGEFHFAVGSSHGLLTGGSSAKTAGLVPIALFRWLLFAGLAISLGGFIGQLLTRRRGAEIEADLPTPWLMAGAVAGLLGAAGLALLVAGSGSLSAGVNEFGCAKLATSRPGAVALAEVGAFAAAFVLFLARRQWLGVGCLGVVAIAEGLRAHPDAAAGSVGALVTIAHVLAAAVWLGALLHVVRVGLARRRSGVPNAGLVAAYARMALVLVLALLATGVIAALLLIPVGDLRPVLTRTGYGRWLLVKFGFVALALGLAVWARRFLRRRTDLAQPSVATRYEVVTLVAVVGISSVLTAVTPPVRSDIPLPFPPPAAGPVVALGTRAGFIGIGVSASQGQILVRLTVPTDAHSDTRIQSSMDLAGNVSTAGDSTKLEFRRCGLGCFVAPVDWQEGSSTVTLRADDDSYPDGKAAVRVVWPAKPAEARLRAVVAAMRNVGHFTVNEQVTSNTGTGLGDMTELPMTGRKYLQVGPYGSGAASTVTLYGKEANGDVTLALGYPADQVFVLLTVTPDNRIVREVLASGGHLITRSLVYEEPEADHGHNHHHHNGE
jgi:copper transport protein